MEKFNLKPFDKVLVRDGKNEWAADIFSHYTKDGRPRATSNCSWDEAIPYEGNEHLLGTTNDYVEPYVPEDGDWLAIEEECELTGNTRKWICIFLSLSEVAINFHVGLTFDNHLINGGSPGNYKRTHKERIRPATEEEKQLLLSKLHEIGKKWNPEKKCIEDVWTPKDGDFIAWGDSDRPAISIFREGDKMHFPTYVSLYRSGDIGIDDINTIEKGDRLFRPATEEEKQQLLDALHKDGKDWDESKKEIVELKWKPGRLDEYFYVSDLLTCASYTWKDDDIDKLQFESGNCFRTREEAQAMADKFKELLKNK